MKDFALSILRTIVTTALFIIVLVGVMALAMLGALMIFGAFFFETFPDLWMALKHLAIFAGGVLSLAFAITTLKALLVWAIFGGH